MNLGSISLKRISEMVFFSFFPFVLCLLIRIFATIFNKYEKISTHYNIYKHPDAFYDSHLGNDRWRAICSSS